MLLELNCFIKGIYSNKETTMNHTSKINFYFKMKVSGSVKINMFVCKYFSIRLINTGMLFAFYIQIDVGFVSFLAQNLRRKTYSCMVFLQYEFFRVPIKNNINTYMNIRRHSYIFLHISRVYILAIECHCEFVHLIKIVHIIWHVMYNCSIDRITITSTKDTACK